MGAFDEIIAKFGDALGRMGAADQQGAAVAAFMQSAVPPKRELPLPPPQGTFQENYARAVKEMREKGITSEQAATYRPINEVIYRGIHPFGYGGTPERIVTAPEGMATNGEIPDKAPVRERNKRRYDAWALYLGMPQTKGTFSISPYQPSQAADQSQTYYRINDFWKRAASKWDGYNKPMIQPATQEEAYARLQEQAARGKGGDPDVMGNFKFGKGQDARGPYLSYYDRWDLDGSDVEGKEGRYGKPFEIYDRLYYSPEKREIYWDGPPQPPVRK